jgi:RNA polymerase sigma-70 factor, ECF subfamily
LGYRNAARRSDTAGGNRVSRDNDGVEPIAPVPASQPPVEPPTGGDERELIASILRNDRKAAARFVAAHIDAVYAYARTHLLPRADVADDVVQEVFLAALNGLAAFQGQSSLRTWLMAIARHKVEDVYRRRLRMPEALDDIEGSEAEPPADEAPLDEHIDSLRQRAKARHVLARLPERYALLLLWRYWQQRSTREMAASIGGSEKSVERALARARARFRELWLEE